MNSLRARPFVPHLEKLEDRCCPTAGVKVVNHTMYIQGDNLANTITITDDGAGKVTAKVDALAVVTQTDIRRIVVDSHAGDDSISYSLGTSKLTTDRALVLQANRGTDTVNVDATGGIDHAKLSVRAFGPLGNTNLTTHIGAVNAGAVDIDGGLGGGASTSSVQVDSVANQSKVTVDLRGGRGADALTSTIGAVADSTVRLRVDLGHGADTFTGSFTGNITGASTVSLAVQGDGGKDNFSASASGITIGPGATLDVALRGLRGGDTLAFNFQGEVDGTLKSTLRAGPGADTASSNITLNAGSTGNLKAYVFGGQGNDVLTHKVIDNSGGGGSSTMASFEAVLYALAGKDTIDASANVKFKKK